MIAERAPLESIVWSLDGVSVAPPVRRPKTMLCGPLSLWEREPRALIPPWSSSPFVPLCPNSGGGGRCSVPNRPKAPRSDPQRSVGAGVSSTGNLCRRSVGKSAVPRTRASDFPLAVSPSFSGCAGDAVVLGTSFSHESKRSQPASEARGPLHETAGIICRAPVSGKRASGVCGVPPLMEPRAEGRARRPRVCRVPGAILSTDSLSWMCACVLYTLAPLDRS